MAQTQPGQQSSVAKNKRTRAKFSGFFVSGAVAIALVLGFVAGTRGSEIVSVIAPQFGVQTNFGQPAFDTTSLQEVYRKLHAKFDGKLDNDKLIEYANRGLVQAAGDDYTQYFSSKEAEELRNDLAGDIGGGIGAELGKRNGNITVIRPLPDSPAAQAGVQAGDVVVAVNDTSVEKSTVDEAVKKIRGDIDTTVKLTVLRDGAPQEISITRKRIVAPDVESKVVDGDIGVITMSRFDTDTGSKVRAAAEDFKKRGVRGVILDLRGNGGGFLNAGVEVAGVWLGDKIVVSERRDGKVVEELRTGKNPVLDGMPTVVLINEGSASASEIVAGALRDHGKATLVGQTSFGKGSVQELVDLSNGDSLKVTIARWYTPNGKNITKGGIAPDVEIELTSDDVNADRDPQLDAAVEKLVR